MTPALPSFDATMGCEKRSSWELKSATLSVEESGNPAAVGSFLWEDLYDEEADTSSFTSSSVRSIDELGASTSIIDASSASTSTNSAKDHNQENDNAQGQEEATGGEIITTTSATKKKKNVQFDPIAMIKCVDKISEEDSKKVWYSPLEMILLRKECIFTLWFLSAEDMSLSDPSASCSERYSIRGLEAQRDQIHGSQSGAKYEALRVVLQEQEYRRHISKQTGPPRLVMKQDIFPSCTSKEDGHHRNPDDEIPNNKARYYYRDNDDNIVPAPLDDEALAEKYAKASDPSKQSALLQGFEDEQVVKMMPYEHPTSKHHRYLFRFL